MSKRTQEARDRNAEARAEQASAHAAAEQITIEQERQIAAAVGNRNEAQVNRRNEIAALLDETPDRATQDFDGDKTLDPDPTEETERQALQAQKDAEAERERLEREANERAAKDEQNAGVVEAEPKKYKLKVNGKEIELTEAELLERAQKVESADEYLHFAKEAVERTQAPAPSKDESANGGEDAIEDTLTSALQGDPEAIKKIAQRLKAPSSQDVLTAVDDRLTFRSAVEWFRGEYKDVVDDPMLYRLAVDEDSRLAKSEPSLSYRERLKRSGEHVRSWRKGLTPTPAANPKLMAKASVAPVPQAGGRQAVKVEDEEEEPIDSVIDKMARARHQNGAIRK